MTDLIYLPTSGIYLGQICYAAGNQTPVFFNAAACQADTQQQPSSPVILWLDLPLIATEPFSSPII